MEGILGVVVVLAVIGLAYNWIYNAGHRSGKREGSRKGYGVGFDRGRRSRGQGGCLSVLLIATLVSSTIWIVVS